MRQQRASSNCLPVDRRSAAPAAILLVGHGTRAKDGQQELLDTADLVQKLHPEVPLEAGFLELAEPSIPVALSRLLVRLSVGSGTHRPTGGPLLVSPLMLFAAGHAKRDIPTAVQRAADLCGFDGSIRQVEHLGCQHKLLRLSEFRYQQSMADRAAIAPEQTLLVFVGRGSRDEQATAEMHEFARRRIERTPVGQSRVCFVAMAEPRFESVMQQISEELRWGKLANVRRVVVQPHLMFRGELLERLTHRVLIHAGKQPNSPPRDDRRKSSTLELSATAGSAVDGRGVEWVVASHLGCHQLLAEAIAARINGHDATEAASDRKSLAE